MTGVKVLGRRRQILPGPDLGVVGGAGVVPDVPDSWNSTRGGGTVGLRLL